MQLGSKDNCSSSRNVVGDSGSSDGYNIDDDDSGNSDSSNEDDSDSKNDDDKDYLRWFSCWRQIRLLLHLPLATDNNLEQLEELYHLLVGLEYYGYRLVYSRPLPGHTYTHYNLDRILAIK